MPQIEFTAEEVHMIAVLCDGAASREMDEWRKGPPNLHPENERYQIIRDMHFSAATAFSGIADKFWSHVKEDNNATE